jgi:hypothetical protein
MAGFVMCCRLSARRFGAGLLASRLLAAGLARASGLSSRLLAAWLARASGLSSRLLAAWLARASGLSSRLTAGSFAFWHFRFAHGWLLFHVDLLTCMRPDKGR